MLYTKKLYFEAKNHLPFSDLWCDQYPLSRRRKRAKNRRFSHVLARDPTGIDRIANRRTGGDFSHRNRAFLYTSLACAINIQILNCDGSSSVFAGEKYGKNPATFASNYEFGYRSHTKVIYTKKFYFKAKNHLPISDLRCDQYPLRRERKRA